MATNDGGIMFKEAKPTQVDPLIKLLGEDEAKKLVRFLEAVERDHEKISYGAFAGFMNSLTGKKVIAQGCGKCYCDKLPVNLQYLIVSASTKVPGAGYRHQKKADKKWTLCKKAKPIIAAYATF